MEEINFLKKQQLLIAFTLMDCLYVKETFFADLTAIRYIEFHVKFDMFTFDIIAEIGAMLSAAVKRLKTRCCRSEDMEQKVDPTTGCSSRTRTSHTTFSTGYPSVPAFL